MVWKNWEEVLRMQAMQIDSLKHDLNRYHRLHQLTPELIPELKVLFPVVLEVSCAYTSIIEVESVKPESVLLVYLKCKEEISVEERDKIHQWLVARVEQQNIKLIIE